MPMDPLSDAFLKVYELTAFLYSAIFAAILLIYALLALYLGRIYKQTREEFERLRKEAESRITTGDGDPAHRAENWRMQIAVAKLKLVQWEQSFQSHTVESTLVRPAGLTLGGLGAVFVAILCLQPGWGFWGIWLSLAIYLAGGVLVYRGLIHGLIPRLKEVENSAKEPAESPVGILHRILKEQGGQSQKQQQATNEHLIAVLERAVQGLERLYALKPPDFKILFTDDGKRGETLEVCLGMEKEIRLAVANKSPFAIEQGLLEVVIPNKLKVSKEGSFERRLAYDYVDSWPYGTSLMRRLGAFPPSYAAEWSFTVETFQPGKHHVKVHLDSTSHERYSGHLYLVAK
jgi:hypothetical protein